MSESVNVGGTKNVLNNRNGVPLVFASTGSVYGKIEDVCNEDSDLNPTSDYGIHKKIAEDLVTQEENTIALRFTPGS